MIEKTLTINLGAISAPLKTQLEEQDLKFQTARDADRCQKLADNLVSVYLGGLLNDSELKNARKKLFVIVKKSIIVK